VFDIEISLVRTRQIGKPLQIVICPTLAVYWVLSYKDWTQVKISNSKIPWYPNYYVKGKRH
jgi:hypothetical protein